MKKILVLLVLIVGAYFALAKWSPSTLDRVAFWKPKPIEAVAPLPTPEPAPQITPQPGVEGATAAPAATRPGEAAPPAAKPSAPTAPAAATVDQSAQVVIFCYHRVE